MLDADECAAIAELYDDDARFRSTIDMARHRFGEGQYRYFAHAAAGRRDRAAGGVLAAPAADRPGLGRRAPANRRRGPTTLEDWLEMCHDAGQRRPTPLLLRYGPGDWNALHRDLYGELVFPLQVVIGLDRPGRDYDGGEFVVVEQRPRAQSRATATTIGHGEAVVFTTRDRPVRSARGWAKAPVRHGVSTVRRGHRRTLGLVFHDAA